MGREGRMAGEGRRLQASEVSGRVMVREPDPGAGFQRNWRKGWQGGGRKRNRRRKTTPELPDQVIAVRCQSAAERGRLGRERRDMRRVRAVWDRERTSVKNKTPSRWLMAGLGSQPGPEPSLGPPPPPHCNHHPNCCPEG